MWKQLVVVLLVCLIAAASPTEEAAVGKVLSDMGRAWNARDLRGYMQGYWNSPELTFYSGGTVTQGWQATMERYQKRYQGEGREMGTLDFEIFEVQVLSKDAAVVYGKWHLEDGGWEGAARAVHRGDEEVRGRVEDRARPHVD